MEAKACEASHITNLDVIDMIWEEHDSDLVDNHYGYPSRIMVIAPHKSGSVAEYVLQVQGPSEDFEPYHPAEYYERNCG
jgi:hypothetical protein